MEIRELAPEELPRVWSIDRSEVIERVYFVDDGELALRAERHDMRGWPEGEPEHYGPLLQGCLEHGGTAWGAVQGHELVAAAVLERRRIGRARDTLQLKFLHVSRSLRGTGLGHGLLERAADRAREWGARRLYVSATSTEATVDFYLRHGFRLADEPDPELLALEPEDIHLVLDLDGAAPVAGEAG